MKINWPFSNERLNLKLLKRIEFFFHYEIFPLLEFIRKVIKKVQMGYMEKEQDVQHRKIVFWK